MIFFTYWTWCSVIILFSTVFFIVELYYNKAEFLTKRYIAPFIIYQATWLNSILKHNWDRVEALVLSSGLLWPTAPSWVRCASSGTGPQAALRVSSAPCCGNLPGKAFWSRREAWRRLWLPESFASLVCISTAPCASGNSQPGRLAPSSGTTCMLTG